VAGEQGENFIVTYRLKCEFVVEKHIYLKDLLFIFTYNIFA